MSVILDALKKAESERSRNAGPVLMDVRVAPSRQRLPGWAWVLGCVLVANLLVLAWLLLRKPAATPVVAGPVATVAPPAAPSPVTSLPPIPPPTIDPPIASAPAAPSVAIAIPLPTLDEPAALAAPTPAVEPERVTPSPPPVPRPSRTPRIDNLPTLQDLLAQGVSLPTIQLNLHVYDELPANRYVLLNAKRLREGDELSDGVRVESIVPTGVVFNARGRRFVLLSGT